ncbi:MAG: hypothetical protein Q9182_002485 [Xanthomendoza sp. 2 TL-2023]
MSKSLNKALFGGHEGGSGAKKKQPQTVTGKSALGGAEERGSSSRTQPPLKVNKEDEEIARRLHEEINGSQLDVDDPGEKQHSHSGNPIEIQNAIDTVQGFAKETLNTVCHKCDSPLLEELDVDYWTQKWESSSSKEPVLGNSKHMAEYEGTKLDWCCTHGGVFVAWIVLCQYDHMELDLQTRSLHSQATARRQATQYSRADGVGFGARDLMVARPQVQWVNGKAQYKWSGLSQALDFKQVDTETDDLTRWVFGMLIALLPKRQETTKKVPAALPSMIELSLLQDRTAQLLRNDSLQDVNGRADLYFATFEFVDRLGSHPKLEYLAREDRFMKKQSAGLHAISIECKGKSKAKGKAKASGALTVASKREGMASSLLACLTNLATQSKVLLSGSSNQAAGTDILEIAQRIQKLNTRLAGDAAAKLATITTWKEYLQAYCVTRKNNISQHLCQYVADECSKIRNSPKGRMARLVTETSEMTTSLPDNVFVMIDEVRPDIMKVRWPSYKSGASLMHLLTDVQALIIGPKGTPYEGGLFEFDIVCVEQYPVEPPCVRIVTTGQGQVSFNPNLYANGKVCLSLLGTWDGPPESKWQPHKSTIASVLVSIQSMILCDNPLENEPAFQNIRHRIGGLEKCRLYDRGLRKQTLLFATLHWLLRPEMREGVWKTVVNDYFRFCGRGVVESARRWEREEGVGKVLVPGMNRGKGTVLSEEIEKAIAKFVR